jgi:hypothetical protein
VFTQTDGEPVPMPEIPEWDKGRALVALGIEQIPFAHTNGNVQGYAKKPQVAISPLAGKNHSNIVAELEHRTLV